MKHQLISATLIATILACGTKNTNYEAQTANENNTHPAETSQQPPATDSRQKQVTTDLVHNSATAQPAEGVIIAPGKEPEMIFEAIERDFGTIKDGEQVEMSYKFTNKGGSDLIISEVKAGCGCTIPDWPKDPIKPGKGGVIKAKFDSTGKTGRNTKKVFVYSNGKEPEITLSFTGQVNEK